MPNFSTPSKAMSVINKMQTAELSRASQRALLDDFFNGKPLWTEQEAKDNRISVNFNDKSGSILLHTARSQYENALMGNSTYCRVTLPDAPVDKQTDWGAFITSQMNRYISGSKAFYHTQDEVFGAVVLHGAGAKMWWDQHDWCPSFVGVQDLLIPTDTDITMSNLQYFAVRRKMRPGELYRKTIGAGDDMDAGWNKQEVIRILDTFKELNQNPNNYDWLNNPEQMAELYKQNHSYYDSDSAPVIWAWEFYHREEMSTPAQSGWMRKIILSSDGGQTSSEISDSAWLYEGKSCCASKLEEIIHFQFGDGNNIPPFKYHSIRSLAFLTYELLWTMNRLRCQWTQHVFEQMLTLFRVSDPNDRSRLQQIIMDSPWGIIPEGLNMVSAGERYAVNPNLVGELRSEYQSLVARSSSTYTQEPNANPNTEKTKFEVQAILASASALMGSMLRRAVKQEAFAAREICRRFTSKNSCDFDVKKFRTSCIDHGIPEKWLDVDSWVIEIEQKLGGGNRMMEIAEASQLMDRVNLFDPEAQAEIKHRWVVAITGNPVLANSIAGVGKAPKVTDSIHDAELAYGTLMQGVPVSPKAGLNSIETVETMLKLMSMTVQQIEQSGGVGTPQQVIGLQLALQYSNYFVGLIGQDPNEGQRVKMYGDVMGRVSNQVKAFAQRQQQAAQAPGQDGGESGVKIQQKLIEAQSQAKINEAKAQQKLAHTEQKFIQRQRLDEIKTQAQIQIESERTKAEVFRDSIMSGGVSIGGQ